MLKYNQFIASSNMFTELLQIPVQTNWILLNCKLMRQSNLCI